MLDVPYSNALYMSSPTPDAFWTISPSTATVYEPWFDRFAPYRYTPVPLNEKLAVEDCNEVSVKSRETKDTKYQRMRGMECVIVVSHEVRIALVGITPGALIDNEGTGIVN